MQNSSSLNDLFTIADEAGISIFYGFFPECGSLAVPSAIALDHDLTEAEEKVRLAHELGHCMRDAFYTVRSSREEIRRQENRADKWAIKKLVPAERLERELEAGYAPFEIADHLGITEEFLHKAWELYHP